MTAEVDLRARVLAAAFERDDHALAELRVEHALAGSQAVAGRLRYERRRARQTTDVAGADDRVQARTTRPCRLVVACEARAEALVARRDPLQRGLGQLL